MLSVIKQYKVVIIIIAIIILIFIIYRNWYLVQRLFANRDINFEEGEDTFISASRKKELKSLAKLLHSDIYSTPTPYGIAWHNTELYKKVNELTDNELLYLSKYFRDNLADQSSLYKDMDDEYYSSSEYPEKVKARLIQIGEQY